MKYATRFQWVSVFVALLSLFSVSNSVSAQNVADNIVLWARFAWLAKPVSVHLARGTSGRCQREMAAVSSPSTDIEPASTDTSAVEVASEFDAEAAYQMSCNACHGTGAAGAPMLGDAQEHGNRG